MRTTRKTLLNRLRDPGDDEAWSEFVALYSPLLYAYASGRGLSASDAEDIRDQVLEVLVRKMPEFEYDRAKGRFKSWLYRIAAGKVVDLLRARPHERIDTGALGSLADPGPTPDEVWDRQWHDQHLRFALERAAGTVSERDFEAFNLLLFEDAAVTDVCARLDINANQVYKAKMRVLQSVRAILASLEAEEIAGHAELRAERKRS